MEKLLEAILKELQAQKSPAPLGFGHPPKPRYIYANRQYADCLWYFWNGAKNEHEPIEHHAITGVITKLEIETKEFRGKPDPKVNLHIKADRPYVIQSGLDTLFAKGLVFTLSRLPKSAFSQPITIAVEPGETEQVLFCRIYNPEKGEAVYAPYGEDVDWADTIAKAQAKINPATTPAPIHAEWDGQQSLTPVDNRGIADRFLADLAAAETLEAVDKLKVHLTKEAFGPAFSLMRQKWEQKRGSLAAAEPQTDLSGLVAEISVLVDRCGWKPKHGSAYLVETYGKRTRAELTSQELVEFRDYLTDRATVTESIGRLSQSAEWDRSAFLVQNFGKMELQLLSLEELQVTEGHLRNLTKQGVWV